jgi:hypothetical protein
LKPIGTEKQRQKHRREKGKKKGRAIKKPNRKRGKGYKETEAHKRRIKFIRCIFYCLWPSR